MIVNISLRELLQLEGMIPQLGFLQGDKVDYCLQKTKARIKGITVYFKVYQKSLKNDFEKEFLDEQKHIYMNYCDKNGQGQPMPDQNGQFMFTDPMQAEAKDNDMSLLNQSDLGINYFTRKDEIIGLLNEKMDEDVEFMGYTLLEVTDQIKNGSVAVKDILRSLGILETPDASLDADEIKI